MKKDDDEEASLDSGRGTGGGDAKVNIAAVASGDIIMDIKKKNAQEGL